MGYIRSLLNNYKYDGVYIFSLFTVIRVKKFDSYLG